MLNLARSCVEVSESRHDILLSVFLVKLFYTYDIIDVTVDEVTNFGPSCGLVGLPALLFPFMIFILHTLKVYSK